MQLHDARGNGLISTNYNWVNSVAYYSGCRVMGRVMCESRECQQGMVAVLSG